MQPIDATGWWLSAHLHFVGYMYGPDGDRPILDVVEPFVEHATRAKWIDRHFFVRYSEQGSHIRLRLHGAGGALQSVVRPGLVAHVRRLWPDVANDGEFIAGAGGRPGEVKAIRWVPYDPELERYGGDEAINMAEALFDASSRVTYALLSKVDHDDRASRLGKALLAMLVLVHVFVRDPIAAAMFAHVYGTANLRSFARQEGRLEPWPESFDAGYGRQSETLCAFINDAWDRLDAAESMLPELDRFRDDLLGLRGELERLCTAGRVRQYGRLHRDLPEAIRRILPSYIHMTHNRLGVTIPEEAYLAYLIKRALETPVARGIA